MAKEMMKKIIRIKT